MKLILFIIILVGSISWAIFSFDNQKKVVNVKLPKIDEAYEALIAKDLINSIRSKVGLNSLIPNQNLQKAASLHANYLVANRESSHFEIEGHKFFVGKRPLDRTLFVNYISKSVSENLSSNTPDAKSSVSSLFSAIYHRFGFLSNKIDEIGVGVKQDEKDHKITAFVYDMGNSNLVRLCSQNNPISKSYYTNFCKNSNIKASKNDYEEAINFLKRANPKIVVFPYDKQTDAQVVFYNEDPDPLPQYDVSGFPISIEFNDYYYKDVKVDSFKLYQGDREVDSLFMDKQSDPNGKFTKNQFALFPIKRLKFNTKYKAIVKYRVGNKEFSKTWSFKTIKPALEIIETEGNGESLKLKSGVSYAIYFPPKNAHDILNDLQFPLETDVSFIDHNTIKVYLKNCNIENFDIKAGDRRVKVECLDS